VTLLIVISLPRLSPRYIRLVLFLNFIPYIVLLHWPFRHTGRCFSPINSLSHLSIMPPILYTYSLTNYRHSAYLSNRQNRQKMHLKYAIIFFIFGRSIKKGFSLFLTKFVPATVKNGAFLCHRPGFTRGHVCICVPRIYLCMYLHICTVY
jgi:hypothetical protein